MRECAHADVQFIIIVTVCSFIKEFYYSLVLCLNENDLNRNNISDSN